MYIYLYIDVAMCLMAIAEILVNFPTPSCFPFLYYTDKPNVFPQEKIKIPYNILLVSKTIIYTLYKAYINTFM